MSLWSYNGSHSEEGLKDPSPPQLSREACLSQKGIRSFLKLSRLASDDTIKQHLNNILDSHDSVIKRSNGDVCNSFINEYLFPHWTSRLETIEFCDKEAITLKQEIDKTITINEKKEVDPRIDPYYERSNKDEIAQKYYDYTQLSTWIQNEKGIESIVQDRSIEILNDRCTIGSDLRKDFEKYSKQK